MHIGPSVGLGASLGASAAPNLVKDGDGSSGTLAAWTIQHGTWTLNAGRIRLTVNDANFPNGSQQLPVLTPGATYKVFATSYPNAGIFARVNVGTTPTGSDLFASGNVTGAINGTFTAPANGVAYVSLFATSLTNGDYAEIDDIVVSP